MKGPKATVTRQGDEYVIDAPEGYRFADIDAHQAVVDFGYEGMSAREGRRAAIEESRSLTMERCPADCECKE